MKATREELIERIMALSDETAEIFYHLVKKYILSNDEKYSSLSPEEFEDLVRGDFRGICEKKDYQERESVL